MAKDAIRIVEVDRGKRVEPMDEEVAQSLLALEGHPGFRWLLRKLAFQKALLEQKLLTERQENQIDAEYIKSGIAWAGWLEGELRFATGLVERKKTFKLNDPERRAFEELNNFIEVVK